MKKLAFVTPWYGDNIPGGAEKELRGLIYHLLENNIKLEVLTTCVKEFNSDWNENFFPEGETVENEVIVRRFRVDKRNTRKFDEVNYKLMNNLPITLEEEEIYIHEMINSRKLCSYIREHKDEYHAFIFIPYMFGTTYYGCLECREKAVLIPCFHDESYIYMNIYKKVFENIKGIIYHAQPEYELANKVFNLPKVNQAVLGEGIDTDVCGQSEEFKRKYSINAPFILYAGRKDKGKNVDTLIKYFREYHIRQSSMLKLVLIGGGKIDIPRDIEDKVIDLGFVSEQDKYNAYAAAELLCQPSENESFSLVMMESWLNKKPVLVNENCNVTSYFVKECNGGLYYKNYFEFEGALNYILKEKKIAEYMGKNGEIFVRENFSWNVIIKKYMKYFLE